MNTARQIPLKSGRALMIGLMLVFLVGGSVRAAALTPGVQQVDNAVDTTKTAVTSYDSVLTEYQSLYRDIATRDADSLWSWLNHPEPTVRRQAWRGMVHAEISDPYQLQLEAEEANDTVSWFALSHHELNQDLRRILEQRWESGKHSRGGISRVLGKQGDRQSLNFLVTNIDKVQGSADEFQTALAVGRLSMKYQPANSLQFKIIQSAFTAPNPLIGRAYLYGAYRSDTTLFSPEIQQNLFRLWQVYGVGRSQLMDQYLVKILGRSYPQVTMQQFRSMPVDSMQTGLGIELAGLLADASADTTNRQLSRRLLRHPNPQVVSSTLEGLRGLSLSEGPPLSFITDSMLTDTALPNRLWAEVLHFSLTMNRSEVDSADAYMEKLARMQKRDPYLTPIYLELLRRRDTGRYFEVLDTLLQQNQPPSNTFAARSLKRYWRQVSPQSKDEVPIDTVRSLMFEALESADRGVAYETTALIEDTTLFKRSDYRRLKISLLAFDLPGDIEVYQAMGSALFERFPQKAKPLIDSLATYHYAALNSSLRSDGWSIPQSSETSTDTASRFRMPDWQRLAELGPNPQWTLRTKHDTIQIQLDPLRAPMTVSAIDSLTRASAYDSVAFHRVVPNFVIQGGDIERGDGFGGPSFTLLTEASEIHYDRGSVGIASAGTDTEGSQYFIMHQWKPHLNGSYTRFGTVIDGMEAVDRMMEGDRVIEATIRATP